MNLILTKLNHWLKIIILSAQIIRGSFSADWLLKIIKIKDKQLQILVRWIIKISYQGG